MIKNDLFKQHKMNNKNFLMNMTNSESPQTNKYKLITRRIDKNKICHKSRRELQVHTCKVKDVKMNNEGNIRSGAIIYTYYNGKTYFCLGIDSIYGDLTDFSGGVKKEDFSIISGGLRELYEESQGVFGDFHPSDVEDSISFHTKNMLTMFIKMDINMDEKSKQFENSIKYCETHEVSNILWLEKKEFINCILGRGRFLYNRVRRMLSKVTGIIQAL